MLKPPRLNKGDKVRLIAPAGPVMQEKFEKLVQIVKDLNLKPVWTTRARSRFGYFSAPDNQRLSDLIDAFSDDTTKAVFCLRGGYGTTRLIDKIPYYKLRNKPKIFLGFSDITALQMAFLKKNRLITFHTSLTSLENEYTKKLFTKIAFLGQTPELDINTDFTTKPTIIKKGYAQGILVGGNLSLLTSLIGTGFLPKFKNRIVFIEDISEPPYKIDRMLTHLMMATDLSKADGILLGVFNKCNWQQYYDAKEKAFSLEEIFHDRLASVKGPIIYGFPLGHIDKMSILPLGAKVNIDTESLKVKLLNPVVK